MQNVSLSDIPRRVGELAAAWTAMAGDAPLLLILAQILLAWLAALVLHRAGTAGLRRVAAPFPISRKLVDYGNQAGRFAVFMLVLQFVLRNDTAPPELLPWLRQAVSLGLIAALTWLGVRCVSAVADTVVELNPADGPHNLRARRIHTQARVLARSVTIVIVLIGAGLALSTLPQLRRIGTSLLASAGLAGLVVGLSARPVLSNLLAGLQLALTQPIRLEDVVMVEGEWGWIEEITGTYVVVRLRDWRRLIVPLQWFIEHPFQNWTRTGSDVLGSVVLKADYRLPVDELRREAERICKASPEWDGRLCQVQAVDIAAQAVQLRILVSAGDAMSSWNLCCQVREALTAFMARAYPDYPPR